MLSRPSNVVGKAHTIGGIDAFRCHTQIIVVGVRRTACDCPAPGDAGEQVAVIAVAQTESPGGGDAGQLAGGRIIAVAERATRDSECTGAPSGVVADIDELRVGASFAGQRAVGVVAVCVAALPLPRSGGV